MSQTHHLLIRNPQLAGPVKKRPPIDAGVFMRKVRARDRLAPGPFQREERDVCPAEDCLAEDVDAVVFNKYQLYICI